MILWSVNVAILIPIKLRKQHFYAVFDDLMEAEGKDMVTYSIMAVIVYGEKTGNEETDFLASRNKKIFTKE